jgi:hypothetical protein
MTTNQLERGTQIQMDIHRLENSLAELLKSKLFDVTDNSYHRGRPQAEPFLAELEVKTRTFATTAITDKIKELNAEFEKL